MSKGRIISTGKKWKKVPIKIEDVFADDVACFGELEELHDYSLTNHEDGDRRETSRSGKKRRSRHAEEDTQGPIPRKKKKQKTEADTNATRKKYDECLTSIPMAKDNEDFDNESYAVWKTLFVPEPILRALADLEFTTPSEIQLKTIPVAIRDHKDIVGVAETGSGKTLAFGIPIITHILNDIKVGGDKRDNRLVPKPCCLIVTPTRELAIQIKDHLVAVAKYTDIKILVIIGGFAEEKQIRLLQSKQYEIIIGTPGRLWDLLKRGFEELTMLQKIKYLVIDEADRMLEKTHFEELTSLLEFINSEEDMMTKRQTFLFSATLSFVHELPSRLAIQKVKKMTKEDKIAKLLGAIGIDASGGNKKKTLVIDLSRKEFVVEKLKESRILCKIEEKDIFLYYFLTKYPGRTLIFCNSVNCVRRLCSLMRVLQLKPAAMYGTLKQKDRMGNLEQFSNIKSSLLITTDVAQRGLDIPNVEHVVHYQVPFSAEAYVHRCGRTARASKAGISVMFVESNEHSLYDRICKSLKRETHIPLFPVDSTILNIVVPRVKLAQEYEKLTHCDNRSKKYNTWITKLADDAEIDLEDGRMVKDLGDDYDISQKKLYIKKLKAQLDKEMKVPLIKTMYTRYPTRGMNLNEILQSKQNPASALRDLQESKKGLQLIRPRFSLKKSKRKTRKKKSQTRKR